MFPHLTCVPPLVFARFSLADHQNVAILDQVNLRDAILSKKVQFI